MSRILIINSRSLNAIQELSVVVKKFYESTRALWMQFSVVWEILTEWQYYISPLSKESHGVCFQCLCQALSRNLTLSKENLIIKSQLCQARQQIQIVFGWMLFMLWLFLLQLSYAKVCNFDLINAVHALLGLKSNWKKISMKKAHISIYLSRWFKSEKVFHTVPRSGTHIFLSTTPEVFTTTFREIDDFRPIETLDQTHIFWASLLDKVQFFKHKPFFFIK